jgi:mannitol/fructose-specific phosphotransferase system IIA component (Ntr-type)
MLSHAVIHAASAEVQVNPITRIDLNIARGIARAVEEERISNIIIGWNGEVSARRRIFGSVLDQLLDEVDEMVMVCKIEKPVNTFGRLVVAVPPFAALEIGFTGTIRSLKLMAEQMGLDMIVVSTDERDPYVRKAIDKIKPDIEVEYKTINLWSDVPTWLEENSSENDLFVLVSSREGNLSWRPGLDRLPRVISQKYPDLSFITTYSSEVESEADQGMGYQQNLEILNQERIRVDLKGKDIRSVLTEMISGDDALENIASERIVKRLLDNSSVYNPEVMPGVILYDSHTSKVDEQILFVGISKDGVNIEQTANQAHIFLLLLSPKDFKVQDHLTMLNRITKLVRSAEEVEKLKKAKTSKEVLKVLLKPRV